MNPNISCIVGVRYAHLEDATNTSRIVGVRCAHRQPTNTNLIISE
jgi:hypothetical protein